MNKAIEKKYYEKAEFFKALAHPTRLFIIHSVTEEKRSVKELAELVGIDISTMSKHLDVLKKNGILAGEKVRNFIYYRLAIPCVLDFMRCVAESQKK